MNNNILFVLIVYGIFIFIFVNIYLKNKNSKKRRIDELNSLKQDDKIVTIGGIHGTIKEVTETTLILTTDGNNTIEFEKAAFARKIVDPIREA